MSDTLEFWRGVSFSFSTPLVGVSFIFSPGLVFFFLFTRPPLGRSPVPRYQLPSSQRGYGRDHKVLRAQLDPIVKAGRAVCWRCGERILPGQLWDLGHDDADRTRYRGPEHARAADCPAGGNRATKRLDRHDPKPRRARWA